MSARSQLVFDPGDGSKWIEIASGTNLDMTVEDMGFGTFKYKLYNTLTNNNQLTNGAGYATTSAMNTAISSAVAPYMTIASANTAIATMQSDINGKVPNSRTITINGTSQDLSANRSWTISGSTGSDNAKAYSSGTAYSLTTTSSKVDFGTTDPSITLPAAGTYLILANLKIEYNGLTNTLVNACNFKLRRTNNTAADISNATTTFNVPPVTLLTATGGDADIAPIIYTTSNSNDVIEMWGNRGSGLSVGAIQVGEASVVAYRIY